MLNYPKNVCYNVVKNIENYTNFISNVDNCTIIDKKSNIFKYRINHKLSYVPIRDTIDYEMKLDKDNITITGYNSNYIKSIKYNWCFNKLQTNKTIINLDINVEFKSYLLIPFWNKFKDSIIEKNISEFTNELSKSRE